MMSKMWGSKLYFQSLNSNRRPYFCRILATLAKCMREFKNYVDLTLHFPLISNDYLIPMDNIELLRDPNVHNSCRCDPIRVNLITEKVVADIENY